ncbi:NAD(P)-dependent dehydrogenase (short-subunit alcohol dehydrogenase family) [Nocardia transvalensis]|uniref:NAD(P)-dependent dehydrogenase (Short-subunit alcohol dehydrogenase family) n=1 Tax=Nocardia transvalensis TaxID=37333 RepID=A0A7W9UMB8_9NOCA|nr:SDR family oxidoreductase [Nocardia transvalensis]MBB5918451.1 NAD(P)-dependent dehydrogenase (short-subunit alcohol dehydrogenase family) [Nocardia transvalensis]
MDSQRIAVVTGASRGIGAQTARVLAARGDHVVINYREKRRRAAELAEEIEAAGGRASIAGADLSDETAARALVEEVVGRSGRIDVLVLNASGGLEHGAPPEYALAINRDAQVRLVRLALPHMPAGGRIVFVTSHQAHFHGRKPVPEAYEPIAASKRAGEDALRALIPELAIRGIDFTVVSGDMIDGTIIVRLLQRRDPDAVAARAEHGALPTIEEFATAVADASVSETEPGHTVYVGGADYLAHR